MRNAFLTRLTKTEINNIKSGGEIPSVSVNGGGIVKYLVVVDMQKDFVDGSLGTPAAVKIVENVCKRIEEYKKEGRIFVTLDTHGENYMETCEGKKLPVRHCIKGTDGWKLAPSVEAALDGQGEIFEKGTFGSVELAKTLGELLRTGDEVELCGLCTDICVISNALLIKAYAPEINITVRKDCCAGVTEESHAAALTTMRSCQIDVL